MELAAPVPLSPVTPNSPRRSSTPIGAPRTPSATSSGSYSSPGSRPPADAVHQTDRDADACVTPGLPPTIPVPLDADMDMDNDDDADAASSRSAGTRSIQPSLTSSMTSRSGSSAPIAITKYAMMGLGTRQGEEQLKEALRGAERMWMLHTAERLERLVGEGQGCVPSARSLLQASLEQSAFPQVHHDPARLAAPARPGLQGRTVVRPQRERRRGGRRTRRRGAAHGRAARREHELGCGTGQEPVCPVLQYEMAPGADSPRGPAEKPSNSPNSSHGRRPRPQSRSRS